MTRLMTKRMLVARIAVAVMAFATAPPVLAQATNLFERQPTSITVDILPGDDSNEIRTQAGRVVEIAILGSAEVDVGAINPRTIRLKGVDVLLVGKSDKSLCKPRDINADGRDDLVCDVRTTGFRVSPGEYLIRIEASTYAGESLLGEDRINVIQ